MKQNIIDLDGLWIFTRENGRESSVHVPHDWAIAGPFDPQGDRTDGRLPWRGRGVYRRTFEISADEASLLRSGGKAYLEVDGAMSSPKITVNGQSAGGWDYGYMSFVLEVGALLKAGENEVAVACDTTKGYSRFYCGGGLFREVRLKIMEPDHVVPGSLAISTPEVTDAFARVVATYESPVGGRRELSFTVEHPVLWEPDNPRLYELEILGEKFRYGIRTFRFTADDGFHLNGRRVQLKGACLHSDLGPLGMAFSRDAARRQLRLMKDMGVNAIRTSHNPPAPGFLDLCDEMGLLVWDECFDKWDGSALRTEGVVGLDEFVIRNLKTFVRRDRNHPSVILWSIGNEIAIDSKDFPTGVNRDRCRRYREAVLDEDATRPVGIGAWEAVTCGAFLDLDVTGWNYARRYLPMRELAPDKPIVYSESGSSFSDYGFYGAGPANYRTDYAVRERKTCGYDHTSAGYSDIPDVEFHRMEKDRFIAGEFIWTGIDYLGEPSPYSSLGWQPFHKGETIPEPEMARSSYYGAVSLPGIPKDRFYLFRSYWNRSAHTVHLLPHWNWTPGAVVPVYLYTDGDEAELFLNGQSLGRRRKVADVDYPLDHRDVDNEAQDDFRKNPYYAICDKYRLRWTDVLYAPGELRAVAYKDGVKIGETTVATAGEPVRVNLSLDPYSRIDDDFIFVQCDLVDAAGVRDPLATDTIRFSVEGDDELTAVCNGDPRDYASFSGTEIKLYFGKAVAVIRRKGRGMVRVFAQTARCAAGELIL